MSARRRTNTLPQNIFTRPIRLNYVKSAMMSKLQRGATMKSLINQLQTAPSMSLMSKANIQTFKNAIKEVKREFENYENTLRKRREEEIRNQAARIEEAKRFGESIRRRLEKINSPPMNDKVKNALQFLSLPINGKLSRKFLNSAYRKKAFEYHPNKINSPNRTRFHTLTNQYELLKAALNNGRLRKINNV